MTLRTSIGFICCFTNIDPRIYSEKYSNTCHCFAEHEGPVSLVSVSSDSLHVLAATSTGNLGFLDVSSRGYNTLMRSHTDTVLGFSVDGIRRHLTTASSDGTVRIWNMDSLHQVIQNPTFIFYNNHILLFVDFSAGLKGNQLNLFVIHLRDSVFQFIESNK